MEEIYDAKVKNAILAQVKQCRKFNASVYELKNDVTTTDSQYSINSKSDYIALLNKAETLINKDTLTDQELVDLNELTDVIVAYEAVTYPI